MTTFDHPTVNWGLLTWEYLHKPYIAKN